MDKYYSLCLIRPGIEPMAFHNHGEHANHYTTEAVGNLFQNNTNHFQINPVVLLSVLSTASVTRGSDEPVSLT